jgi:hypothetical protein
MCICYVCNIIRSFVVLRKWQRTQIR